MFLCHGLWHKMMFSCGSFKGYMFVWRRSLGKFLVKLEKTRMSFCMRGFISFFNSLLYGKTKLEGTTSPKWIQYSCTSCSNVWKMYVNKYNKKTTWTSFLYLVCYKNNFKNKTNQDNFTKFTEVDRDVVFSR